MGHGASSAVMAAWPVARGEDQLRPIDSTNAYHGQRERRDDADLSAIV
jgi:hypothetical protein